MKLKLFRVVRVHDESGISGTGHVIDGVVFDDGTTVIKWLTDKSSIAIYESYEDFKFLHIDSHPDNKTEVMFYEIKDVMERVKSVV